MLRLDGHGTDEEDQEEDVEEGEDVVDSAEAAVFLIVLHERERERDIMLGGWPGERDEMAMTGNIGAGAQPNHHLIRPLLSSPLLGTDQSKCLL